MKRVPNLYEALWVSLLVVYTVPTIVALTIVFSSFMDEGASVLKKQDRLIQQGEICYDILSMDQTKDQA